MTLGPGPIPRQLGGFTHDIINDLQGNRGAVAFNAPVNGARSTGNSYILDGSYNTDRNVFSIAVVPLMETVSEFRIQSSLAPAEFAQSGRRVIDVVTKSGSPQFHGNLFEFLRNEATDARGFFDVPGLPRGVFRQNQYGATLGGPLGPVHVLLCVVRRAAEPFGQLNPAFGARRDGTQWELFRRRHDFDPLSLDSSGNRLPFAGNMIPASRIDRAASRYLALYEPLPNVQLANGDDYVDSTPNRDHSDNGSMRVDRAWGERSRLFARYTINDERTLLAGSFPALPTSESLRAQQALHRPHLNRLFLGERNAFFLHQAPGVRSSGQRVRQQRAGQSGNQRLAKDPFTYGLPALTVTDYEMVQDSSNLPQVQRDNTSYLSSSFSRTQGRHTWKAGFQFTHFTMAYLQSQFARGNFIFNGAYTQDPANPNTTGDAFRRLLARLSQSDAARGGICPGLSPPEHLRRFRAG